MIRPGFFTETVDSIGSVVRINGKEVIIPHSSNMEDAVLWRVYSGGDIVRDEIVVAKLPHKGSRAKGKTCAASKPVQTPSAISFSGFTWPEMTHRLSQSL
jgi:hypothetical protein